MTTVRFSREFSLASTLCAALCLVCPALGIENAAESESRLRETVGYLSSDELEGRGVGTPGIDKAAEFLAGEFKKLGLKTDLYEGTPYQEFEVTIAAEMGPTSDNRLSLIGPASAGASAPSVSELKLGESFTPLAVGGKGQFDAPLVFAGYGITAKDLKRNGAAFTYDDYAGIDAKDKVVIIIRKEPQQKDSASPFDGTQTTQHAVFTRKISNANEHGAAAVILVNDFPEVNKPMGVKDELLPFTGAGETSTYRKLPVYFCTRAAINAVLKQAGGKDLDSLERDIDSDLVPRSFALTGWKGRGEANVVEKKAKTKNVIAVLEGEGPLADETIVLGAHYDHLGHGGNGSLAPWTTDIHNGADDNASGTATLLEVAQRLSRGPKPQRRIVFIAFTGEERGLLGSARYTREPRYPLEKTVAMFNLDMVGRLTDDKLVVYGTGTATEFDPLVERLCQELGFKLTKQPGGFGPSDHSSFYSKKVPVLHLFTGTHKDYHRPSDDADKLNIAGMRRVADFLMQATLETDRAKARPTYVEIRQIEKIALDPSEGERPSFGSMPAYPNPVPDGVLLEAVLEGSPAEKAGIKGGDVLIRFGESKITVLEDFENALRKHKPGDRVRVAVRRGTESVEAEVTLGRRRSQ